MKSRKKSRFSYIAKCDYSERFEIQEPVFKKTPGPGTYNYDLK